MRLKYSARESASALAIALLSACSHAPPPVPLALPIAPQRPFIAGDPPVIPWRETIISDNGAFEQECMTALMNLPKNLSWTFGDKLLTQAPNGALIWRADYSTPRDPPKRNRLNRVICSVTDKGGINMQMAFEQKVDRLSISAAELETPGP